MMIVSTQFHRAAWAAVFAWALVRPLAAAPEIATVTEPACNGEVIVITGEGINPQTTTLKAFCLGTADGGFRAEALEDPLRQAEALHHAPALPAVPPDGALDCAVVGGGAGYVQAVMKCSRQPWIRVPAVTALWAGDGKQWSRPLVVNRPQAHWAAPANPQPGDVVRIFGRTFAWDGQLPPATAFLRAKADGRLIALRRATGHHEDGHTDRWRLAAWLPEDLAPGAYQLLVHGGHGGPFGWSEPLALTVAAPTPAGSPTINVRDLGAQGDGLSDDLPALTAALQQAAGGGTVLLPPGTYAVSRTLKIPEGVCLRGTGMHQSSITNRRSPGEQAVVPTAAERKGFGPALVHGMGHFTLQDLTLRFMPASGAALKIGQDEMYVEDVELHRVRFESQQDYSLSPQHDYTSPPVTIYNARRLRMIRCETFGPGGVSCDRKLEACQFAQNLFTSDRRWRGHVFKFWGAEHCIFEDNILRGDVRGLVMQTHFGVNFQNFIAGNTVERTVLGGNAGETYLVEGAGLFLESPVADATADSLTTADWPAQHDETRPHRRVVGRFVVIAAGRGLGQCRRITAVDAPRKTLTVDRPWRVVPDQSSIAVVMNGLVDNIFVNNQEIDCGKGLYLYYAGAINNVVDRHLCQRSLGVTLMTLDERQAADAQTHQTAPDFGNLIRDCRIDGGGIFLGAGGRLPLGTRPALPGANFANRVIGNEILHAGYFTGAQYGATWRWGGGWSSLLAGINLIPMDLGKDAGSGAAGPPRMVGNVIQDNFVGMSPVGVGVSQRAADTLLYKNHVYQVPTPAVDKGQNTRQIDTVVHDADEYTPERGPIR